MTSRDSLHTLVDALPEEAVERMERILQHHQQWPPRHPRDGITVRDQVRKRVDDYYDKHPPQTGGIITTIMSGGRASPEGDASFSARGWEGDTLLEIEHRVFRGQKLETERRFRITDDKKQMLYTEILKGPKGKEEVRETAFDVT